MILDEIISRFKEDVLSEIYVGKKGFEQVHREPIHKTTVFVLVFVLLGILLFTGLGSPPIYILDEARNAQCAKEMMEHHTWIVPTFNGRIRTDKPPLHYFFMIVAYKIFGVSPFSARFFSAVFGLLTIGLITLFTNKYLGRNAALFTSIVLSASTHFIFEFRLAVPDPYFIFFTTAGLLSGFTWLKENKPAFLYLAAASLALGTLAKGPVAVILPVISFLIFTAYKKNWKNIFSWHLLPAFLVFLAVSLPWYVLVHKATNGEWTNSFFLEQNLGRYSSSKEGHSGFFLLPSLIVLLGLLPFSAFIGEIVKKRKILFDHDATVFSMIAFAVVVSFFSLSATQLPNYAMPAYPFASILLGYYISKMLKQKINLPQYVLYITTAFFCIVPFVVYYLLKSEAQTTNLTWIASILMLPALLSVIFLVGMQRMTAASKIFYMAVISFTFGLLIFLVAYPKAYSNNPVAKTLHIVKAAPSVISYRHYNAAYNFYLDEPIKKLEASQIDSACRAIPGTVVITTVALMKELDSLHLRTIATEHDIFERRETVLLTK